MSRLGSMVVRLALENLAGYKADLDKAAQAAKDGADKIDGAMDQAAKKAEWLRKRTEYQANELTQAIDKQVSALVQEAATFGMSAGQLTIYKLATEGATEAQLNQAKAALISMETMRASSVLGGQVGSALKTGALAAAAGAAAAYVAWETLVGSVSKYKDLAEQTGGDPAGLAALRTAADVGGTSIDSLAMAANRMQRSLASVDAESKGVGQALGAIGIRVEEFKQLGADQQLRAVATALNKYADGGGKVAVVQEILGRGATSYLSALKELGNETQVNIGLTNEQIGKADDYKDAQARAKSELLQYAEALSVSALPSVTAFTGAVRDTIGELVGAGSASSNLGKNVAVKDFASSAALLLANVADVAYDVGGAFRFVGNNLGAMAAIAAANLRLDFEGARAIGQASEEQNAQILKGLGLAEKVQARIDAMNASGGDKSADKELEVLKQLNFEKEKAARRAAKPDNSAARELEKEAATLATLSGLNTNYLAELNRVVSQREKGNISEERYLELVTELIAKQPMAKKLMDDNTRAAALADKQMAQSNAEYVKGLDTLDKSIEKIQSETEKEVAKAAALGLTKVAAAELAAVELERDADAIDRNATRAEGLGLEGETTKRYREQAQALRDLAAAKRGTALRETAVDTEKDIAAERKRGWEETDRLAREVFVNQEISAQRVGDVLKKALKSAIYEATLKPLVFQMYTSATGGAVGGALANAAGSNLMTSAAGTAIGSTVGSVFGTGGYLAQFGSGFSGSASAASAMMGGAELTTAASIGSAVGVVAPYVLAAMALKSAMDYSVTSKGNGLTATLGANGIPSGRVGTYSEFEQVGGLFGGGTTTNRDWGVADQSVANYIGAAVGVITASNRAYADAIGLTSEKIDGFTKSIEVSLTGLDAAGQRAAIDAELTKFATEQAAAAYGDALKAVARDGETTSVTVARLATDLGGVNSAFGALGYTLYDVSVAGAAAASGMAQAFGSLQNFQAQTAALFQNYYTADEQRANAVNNAAAGLNAAGITGFTTADIAGASREQIRAVVDQYAAGRGTATGDSQYAAVVSAANALTQFVPAFVEAAKPVVVAASAGGSSGSSSGGGSVTDSALSDWERAAQAIVDTMADLRTTIIASGPDKFERLQGQLLIEMAQAKAGSLAALQNLPQLAKATSSAYAQQNTSYVDQAVFNARLVESLGTVASFDVGTDYVPHDMLAMVHEGERITPKGFNPTLAEGGGSFAGGGTEVAQLLREMVARLQSIAVYAGDTNTSSKTTADVLQQATRGQPIRTKAVT